MDEKSYTSVKSYLRGKCSELGMDFVVDNDLAFSEIIHRHLLAAINEGQIHPAIFEEAQNYIINLLENGPYPKFLDWAIKAAADPPSHTVNQIVTKNTPKPYSYDGNSSSCWPDSIWIIRFLHVPQG